MSLGTRQHMGDEDLERYSMGSMSEGESARCEEHLLVCEACQARVTSTDTYVSAMRSAATELRHKHRERNWRSLFFARVAPLAAAAAFAIILVALGLRLANRGPAIPAVVVNLEATRGAAIAAQAPVERQIILNLDLTGVPALASYRLSVVDSSGNVVWNGEARPRDGKATATLPRLNGGIHFVRIYSAAGELLREYGLEVTAH